MENNFFGVYLLLLGVGIVLGVRLMLSYGLKLEKGVLRKRRLFFWTYLILFFSSYIVGVVYFGIQRMELDKSTERRTNKLEKKIGKTRIVVFVDSMKDTTYQVQQFAYRWPSEFVWEKRVDHVNIDSARFIKDKLDSLEITKKRKPIKYEY